MSWFIKDSKKKIPVKFFSWENLRSLVPLFLLVFAFRWSVAAPYHVPTPSMEPSIKVGDRLLGNHLAYRLRLPFTNITLIEWAKPVKGDIVVFDSQTESGINMVKRVVATAGDKLQFINNQLFINGELQTATDHQHDRSILSDVTDYPEEKVLYKENLAGAEHWMVLDNRRKNYRDNISDFPTNGQPYVIPSGFIFASGDNRHNSSDSRVWGTVPVEDVYGKGEYVIWSMFSTQKKPGLNFRWDRFFTELL
jgi:signal peptidase I